MDGWPAIVAVAVWAGVMLVAFFWVPRRNHGIFVETARRLGLPAPTTGPASRMQWIRGEVRGVEVDIQTYLIDQPGAIMRNWSKERPSLRTRVVAYGAPVDLNLRSQSIVDTAYQAVTHPDIHLGDDRFDREAVIEGSVQSARLALDATTRVLVLELFRHGGKVVQGRVEIDYDGTPWSAERLSQSAFTVINLARRLKGAARDEAERVRRLITADPSVGVRRATLVDTLAGNRALVTPLLPALLTDRDPTIRILAGCAVGAEARPVLLAALAETDEPTGILAALEALSGDGGPDVEPAVLRHLADRTPEVQVAAARILTRIGTAASVEPLTPLSGGLTTDGDVKVAARKALAAIRSRLGAVEGGRLSIADADQGALSLTAERTGAVSLGAKNAEEP